MVEREKREEGRHSVTSLVTAESVKSGSSECGNSRSIDLVCFVLLFGLRETIASTVAQSSFRYNSAIIPLQRLNWRSFYSVQMLSMINSDCITQVIAAAQT